MAVFGRTRDQAHEQGICIRCGQDAIERLKTRGDWNEYQITAFCPPCSEALAVEPDEEDCAND